MNTRFKNELHGLFCNLLNGLRLLIFKRVPLKDFYVSHDQLLILTLIMVAISFIGSFILSLPDPEFSHYGVATITIQLFFIAIAVYLYSKIYNQKKQILSLYIFFLSVWPLFQVIWLVIGKSATFNYWMFYGSNKFYYIFLNLWIIAVVVTALSRAIEVYGKRVIVSIVIYIMVLGIPLNYLTFGSFWHLAYDYDEELKKYLSVNQETTYYNQFQFIEEIKKSLLPQRDGITDIYFVGFGSYGDQDVFMKEVQYAQQVLDDKYNTKGRSVALINNLKTLEEIPLASKSNLNLVLKKIGTLLDPDDDILFLYLTSHGSKKHKLSVTMSPLSLNSLDPFDLKMALNNTSIKYKIILVSACYSGGFVEPLKDDYTLVFTASAKDKTSFGCGNKSEFTYFGRAIFKDNIGHNFNLIDVFEQAMESIRSRENLDELEHSEPQLFIGSEIRKKLLELKSEIETYNFDKNNN